MSNQLGGTFRIRFIQDDDPTSPREFENIGHMVTWHRRYELGDEQPKESPQEWLESFRADHPKSVLLPLFLIDHSGISISTRSFAYCDPGEWDSGQVGWIYCTPEDLKKAGHPEGFWDEAEITKWLTQEVATYDQFLTGDVFGYVLEKRAMPAADLAAKLESLAEDAPENGRCAYKYAAALVRERIGDAADTWVDEDSCWGFYGHDDEALEAALSNLAEEHHALARETWERDGIQHG